MIVYGINIFINIEKESFDKIHWRRGEMAKILKSLFLDKDQIRRLKQLSEKTRVPQAVYIREGIELVLSKYNKRPYRNNK